MCTLFDEIERESEVRGIVDAGYDFEIPENDIFKRQQNKLNVSMQQGQKYLRIFRKETTF